MITSYPVHGFGAAGSGGSSLAALVARVRANAQNRRRSGFGAAAEDWDTFYNGGASAYQDAGRLVYCNRDSANRIQCVLQSYPAGSKAKNGPVADMQRAIDTLINQIPVWHDAIGNYQATVTDPTTGNVVTTTINPLPPNPIGSQAGYDGVVGPSTVGYATTALILAGALKQIPIAIGKPFIAPTEENITAYAFGIAQYLDEVNSNFAQLLSDYKNRGRVPASDVFDPSTVPSLAPFVPPASKLSRNGAIIGAAAAMMGIVGTASWNAARNKPHMMYDNDTAPAFGRRRRRNRRR